MNASTDNLLDNELSDVQRLSFEYFLNETNPANGLIADETPPGRPLV